MLFSTSLAGQEYGVFFYPQGSPIFSANKIYKIFATFESPYLCGDDGFVSWNKLKINYTKFTNNEIYAYVRASDTKNDSSAMWVGPFLQSEYDITSLNKQFIQIKIILLANYLNVASPILNSINISYFKLGSEEKFFTKILNLGFKPKNIILTYNGTIPDSTVIQFAVSGKDTTDSSDFHSITPNSIEDISENPDLNDKIKIMISGVGNQNVPFIIDEFSFMLSGDEQVRLN